MVAVRKTRGGVLLVEEREWFARLVAQGVSNAEACRIVGINRKTGIRWRYGRTIRNTAGEAVHYLPVRVTAPTAPHPRYLSLAECQWPSGGIQFWPDKRARLAGGLMVCLWPCRSGLCVLDVVGIFTVLRGRLGVDRVAGICPVLLLPG